MPTKYMESKFRYNPYGERLEYIEFTEQDAANINGRIQDNTDELTVQDGRITDNANGLTAQDGRITNNTNELTVQDGRITNNTNELGNKINVGGAANDVNTHPTLIDSNKIAP